MSLKISDNDLILMFAISVCSGKNLDTAPVSVVKWDTVAYEGWHNYLVKFANTAYTQADKDTFKLATTLQLPPDFKGVLFDNDVMESVVASVNAKVAAKDTGELAGSDSEGTESEDSDDEGAGRTKRPAAVSPTPTRKCQKIVGEGKDKVVEVSSQLVKVNGILISKYELQREENIRRNKAALEALNIDKTILPQVTRKKVSRAPAQRSAADNTEPVERRQSSRFKGTQPTTSLIDEPMDSDLHGSRVTRTRETRVRVWVGSWVRGQNPPPNPRTRRDP